ncbi:MAG: MlaD family protein, partial [Deltaproteobacteria bacterium]
MRHLSSTLKVGLLLLVAMLGGWFLYRVVVQRAGGSNGYHVYALFRDASGLVPRSRITIAGIPVGTIESIRLQDGMARVTMTVSRDVALFDDATVSRRSSSLLGEYVLILAPGTQGMHRIDEGDRVRVLQEGSSTDDILNNVNAITVRVRQVVDRVGDVFGTDDGRRQMADALRNLQEVSAEVNRTVHANSETITHALRNIDGLIAEGRPEV